jgi:SAM-dependent methyltransferase
MPDHDRVDALLHQHYGEAARRAAERTPAKECCEGVGASVYDSSALDELPDEAVSASIGCANPVAIADLSAGEDVLDLGSGGGIDVLLSARRVAPTGMAYGLDMTDEMLELARANQQRAGITNATFLSGHMEDIPLPDDSVDVVLSNCVVNLSLRKEAVFAGAFRVLRSGGRMAIADIAADREPDAALLADPKAWTDCIAGALTRQRYAELLTASGFVEIELADSHLVQEGFWSVIVRARKP